MLSNPLIYFYSLHSFQDANFHNGDGGCNLVEQNTILLPRWHGWDVFATGGAEWGHKPPGRDNILLNNVTYTHPGRRGGGGPGVFGTPGQAYTFSGFGKPLPLYFTHRQALVVGDGDGDGVGVGVGDACGGGDGGGSGKEKTDVDVDFDFDSACIVDGEVFLTGPLYRRK